MTRNETKDERLWKEIGEEVRRDTDKLFKIIGEAYAVLSDPAKVKYLNTHPICSSVFIYPSEKIYLLKGLRKMILVSS